MTAPFWQRIGGSHAEIASILTLIADEVEQRGDRDPGETADWLRAEALVAREATQ